MEFQEFLQIIKKRWLFILIIILSITLSSASVSYFIVKPTYKSNISVIIEKVGTDTSNKAMDYSDVLMYQTLVKTYAELAKSRTVAENAINNLKLDMKPEALQKMISITSNGDTEFLTIAVKSKNPEQAMLIANQLAKSLKEVSITVKKMDNVQILDQAQLPTAPDSPKPLLNVAIALFLSLMMAMAMAFLLEHLDNTVKSQEDIEKLLSIPVIGIIPYEEKSK